MKGRRNHHHHHHHHSFSPLDKSPPHFECSFSSTSVAGSSTFKEQDRFLPIANVSRIMKRSLPANAKVSKEAKETVQESVSEFISFVTGEASDKCQREKRKTINGDDLLWAMSRLGFDKYVPPLKAILNKYHEVEVQRSSAMRTQMELHCSDDQASPHPANAMDTDHLMTATGFAYHHGLYYYSQGFGDQ